MPRNIRKTYIWRWVGSRPLPLPFFVGAKFVIALTHHCLAPPKTLSNPCSRHTTYTSLTPHPPSKTSYLQGVWGDVLYCAHQRRLHDLAANRLHRKRLAVAKSGTYSALTLDSPFPWGASCLNWSG